MSKKIEELKTNYTQNIEMMKLLKEQLQGEVKLNLPRGQEQLVMFGKIDKINNILSHENYLLGMIINDNVTILLLK